MRMMGDLMAVIRAGFHSHHCFLIEEAVDDKTENIELNGGKWLQPAVMKSVMKVATTIIYFLSQINNKC